VTCSRCGGVGLYLTFPTRYETGPLSEAYLKNARANLDAADSALQAVLDAGDAGLDARASLYKGVHELTRGQTWLHHAGKIRGRMDEATARKLGDAVKRGELLKTRASEAFLQVARAAVGEYERLLKTFKDDKTPHAQRVEALRRMVDLNGLADTYCQIAKVRYPAAYAMHKPMAQAVAGRKQGLADALAVLSKRDALLKEALQKARKNDFAGAVAIFDSLAKLANAAEIKDLDDLCQKATRRPFAEPMGRARFYGLAAGQECGKPTDFDAAAFVATGLRLWGRGADRVRKDLDDLNRKADDRLRRIEAGVSPGNRWPARRKKAEANIKRLGRLVRFMDEYRNKAVRKEDQGRIRTMADDVRRLQDRFDDIERKFNVRPDPDEPRAEDDA
jgi:hypothetical protein